MRGVIDGPAYDLQIFFSRGGEQLGTYQVAADGQLACADLERLVEGFFNVAVVEQSGHHGRFNFSDVGQNCGVEGNNDGSRDFPRLPQGADECVFAAPGAAGLHFQVKDHVVFFGEVEDFIEGGDAFAGEFAAEPGTGVQAQQQLGAFLRGDLAPDAAIAGELAAGEYCLRLSLRRGTVRPLSSTLRRGAGRQANRGSSRRGDAAPWRWLHYRCKVGARREARR